MSATFIVAALIAGSSLASCAAASTTPQKYNHANKNHKGPDCQRAIEEELDRQIALNARYTAAAFAASLSACIVILVAAAAIAAVSVL
jgi:Mn2+/Fe2+ NRAMP family transporter